MLKCNPAENNGQISKAQSTLSILKNFSRIDRDSAKGWFND